MHIILYGDKGVGKSTIIDRIIGATAGKVCGFRTCFPPGQRDHPQRQLFLLPAGKPANYANAGLVASFFNGQLAKAYPEVFNALGPTLLRTPRDAALRVMDECGRFEDPATFFKQSVLECLDEEIPVIAVVRRENAPWVEQICIHPKALVFHVTPTNRDHIFHESLQQLKSFSKGNEN